MSFKIGVSRAKRGFTHFYLKDMSKLASWPDFAEACTERVTQRQSGETHGQMC